MTPENVITFIKPILEAGVQVEMYYMFSKDSPNKFCIDLRTQGKSNCILSLENGTLYASRRYDRKDEVQDLDHLLELVSECSHGREYFNYYWVELLNSRGLSLS